ncbi:MAG: LysR family transcriptional regulator [Ottowia sp.]|uniref:LysR family transcriptional regulator n=1 Tax=unclassified Ottowia TaxID=2645081 RepID=UPI003C2CF7EA
MDELDLEPNRPSRSDHLRLKHFKLLALIARHGSLTAASEALRISQPRATKLLQEMEIALRQTLVDRGTRGGVLTAAGQRALERGRIAIHALHALDEQLGTRPERPLVRMGILRLAGISILPGLVHQLEKQESLPRLLLHEASVSGLMADLVSGALDIVISRLEVSEEPGWMERFDISLLQNDPYEMACATTSKLANRRSVRLDELVDHPWIVTPKETYTRQAFDVAFLGLGMQPPVPVIESPSFHASFAIMAENTSFLTIAPRSSVRYYEALGKIKPVKLRVPFPEDRMVLAIRRDALAIPAVVAVKRALTSVRP